MRVMNKTILSTAALLGLTAVVLGALGAHALKASLPAPALESFQTAVEYQMYHALFLLFLGGQARLPENGVRWIYRLILTGVLCFSGSIYLLSTRELTGLDFTAFAWITPLGGLFLILGWGLLFYRVLKSLD